MGRHLAVPAVSVSPADAGEHFAHLGHFVALDSPATAAVTRQLLGWEPTGPSLLEDLEQDHYYRQAAAAVCQEVGGEWNPAPSIQPRSRSLPPE